MDEAMTPRTVMPVKVVPGSSRDAIVGWLGETLKVRVSAPPERGKANAAITTLLATALGTDRTAVTVVAGNTTHRKMVEVTGLAEMEVRRRLAHYAARS